MKAAGQAVSIHVLIDELFPLLEQIEEQSKRHEALVDQAQLRQIAAEGRRLLAAWASDDMSVRRVLSRGEMLRRQRDARRARERAR